MYKKLITLAALMTGASMAMAQTTTTSADAGMAAGGGMGAMMDPAERFKQLDKNSDGKLTLEEFTTGMQMMRPGGGQGGTPPAGAQQGAPSGDGMTAGGNGMGGMMIDPAERFKKMDTNNDGSVTLAEFTAAMQAMRNAQGGPPPASTPSK